MTQDTNAKEPTKAEELSVKEEEAKKKLEEAKKEQREFIQKMLKDAQFKIEDDNLYSFNFEGGIFSFRGSPTFIEKTRIKSLLSEITSDRVGIGVSSTMEIINSGDMDLICSARVYTHTKVLMEKCPKGFTIDSLEDHQTNNLGYLILNSEREFSEQKKKASTGDQ